MSRVLDARVSTPRVLAVVWCNWLSCVVNARVLLDARCECWVACKVVRYSCWNRGVRSRSPHVFGGVYMSACHGIRMAVLAHSDFFLNT